VLGCAADIDILQAVAIDVAAGCFGASRTVIWEIAFIEEVVIVAFLVAVEGSFDLDQQEACCFAG